MTNIAVPQIYELDGVAFDGLLVSDGDAPRHGFLVLHGWEGRSEGQERFAARLSAVGFCFGGLCALDLARANAPLQNWHIATRSQQHSHSVND
jgi:hypothetical protein